MHRTTSVMITAGMACVLASAYAPVGRAFQSTQGDEAATAQFKQARECLRTSDSRPSRQLATPGICRTGPERLQENMSLATALAARAGDPDAQLCFIHGGFYPTEKSEVDSYPSEAKRYIKDGLARGDWRIVQTLAMSPESSIHLGQYMALRVNIGLPFTAYRATKLLRLGAMGGYAKLLDEEAASYARNLTPVQIRNADEWAREQYANHFSRNNPLNEAPKTCLTETL